MGGWASKCILGHSPKVRKGLTEKVKQGDNIEERTHTFASQHGPLGNFHSTREMHAGIWYHLQGRVMMPCQNLGPEAQLYVRVMVRQGVRVHAQLWLGRRPCLFRSKLPIVVIFLFGSGLSICVRVWGMCLVDLGMKTNGCVSASIFFFPSGLPSVYLDWLCHRNFRRMTQAHLFISVFQIHNSHALTLYVIICSTASPSEAFGERRCTP